jgi:hypothetical protein
LWSEAFTLKVDDILKLRETKKDLISLGIIRLPSHQNGKHLEGRAILVLNNKKQSLSKYLKEKLLQRQSVSQEESDTNFKDGIFTHNFNRFVKCFYDHIYYRTGISKYEFRLLCNGSLTMINNPHLDSPANSLLFHLELMDGKLRPLGTNIAIEDLNFLRLHYCNPLAHQEEDEEEDDGDQIERDLENSGLEQEQAVASAAKRVGKRHLLVYSSLPPASKIQRAGVTKT